MDINFDKTDRLIDLIEDSYIFLASYIYKGAYDLKHSKQPHLQNLYHELVKITSGDMPEGDKHVARIRAFAQAYGKGNDLEQGEELLKFCFDEDRVLKSLTRAYWQIQTFVTFKDESNNNFKDSDSLFKLIEKLSPEAPYKEVIVDVVRKQEPRIKDIEKEFWSNCTSTATINDFCNIYRERWRNHLKQLDKDLLDFKTILFDESRDFNKYFKELRLCGLLQQTELYAECMVSKVAIAINRICEQVVAFFRRLRTSTKPTEEIKQEEQEEQNNFNRMPIKEAKAFFEPLTVENSKNGKPFLTPEQLQAFYKRAFHGDASQAKQTLNVAPKGEALFITHLFYSYYSICTANYLYEPDRQCRDKYIKLLTDNFTNWSFEKIRDNFNKSTSRSWKQLLK